MSTSRAESHYGRHRSDTAQSVYRAVSKPSAPLKVGDSKVLSAWVHDTKESPHVRLNRTYWPGVAEGDLLKLTLGNAETKKGVLFIMSNEDNSTKPQMQVHEIETTAWRHTEMITFLFPERRSLSLNPSLKPSVDKTKCQADHAEFVFQDLYLGRNDMWRLSEQLVGQCVHVDQEISFIGSVVAKVDAIYVKGEKVSSAYVTSTTKAIYRSLSAKVTIFIQVCRELWEFAGDGERYNEKIVHSFLPELFSRWRDAGANHTVTIVLISRVFYDSSELEYAEGPLRQDEDHRWYKDFYKVITDLEVIYDWQSTLVSLKDSFWDFQRDILLTHHYHNASLASPASMSKSPEEARLVGRLSFAHDGPFLEALNMGLNPTETHYIDRSLSLTGSSTIVITPGTGYYRVSKYLLRLTTTRMLDQGFCVDLVSLAKPPLHRSPIFSFQGVEPEVFRHEKTKRFVARAKMHEIQMLGLLDHDILSSIEVPLLPEQFESLLSPVHENNAEDYSSAKIAADKFDMDVFALKKEPREPRLSIISRTSNASSGSGTVMASPWRPSSDKRPATAHRTSTASSNFPPIEESPLHIDLELPVLLASHERLQALSARGLSTSPSQSSVRSVRSSRSAASTSTTAAVDRRSRGASGSRSLLASKLTPTWLFNPFRSGPSQPETSPVLASARGDHEALVNRLKAHEEGTTITHKGSPHRGSPLHGSLPRYSQSPVNTPPRDDSIFEKRRSGTLSTVSYPYSSSSSPALRPNPSSPQVSVSYSQASLARRWQHMFPTPLYKHEIKWKFMITPVCLPLTTEQFPMMSELETSYDVFSYDFVVDLSARSFLVRPPNVQSNNPEEVRRAWAFVVMRGMVALRLAQGFQFVLRPSNAPDPQPRPLRRTKSYVSDDDMMPKPGGAAEAMKSQADPVYLSMSNEIHRISYNGEAIQVRRYMGVGYTELVTSFTSRGLENYGWNRLDMLVAGYEHQFNESLRYWRTRFVVIPTAESASMNTGLTGEGLNEEETRILGIEKLAELFSRNRWQPPDERGTPLPPIQILPTDLGPSASVLDEHLMARLDEIHSSGPLKKKMKSERDIADMSLAAIAKAMREEDGLQLKEHRWHRQRYPDSFIGSEFVNWLVREFRDVSSREQGAEWGTKLQEQGLFEHCRGKHGFLDGHYFYQLKGEYVVASTPRGWFRSSRLVSQPDDIRSGHYPSNLPKAVVKKMKKRLILSQRQVIDIDPSKKSDQAESVILHHDIIHNPATVFHFELHWIGTTARCIEDLIRQWTHKIERYGLKLVEAYVTQISDIASTNPFQSCFPVRLAIPPPIVLDLAKRVPEGTQVARYFEYALLRKFGFVLDIEAEELYPKDVDPVYSYRRAPFTYSQFVHRSGVAFVQVVGGAQGFLFLTNRLMGPGRVGAGSPVGKGKEVRPAAAAEELRIRLQQFCADKKELDKFYDEELALLGHAPEEPPALSI
ncbi:hypothetical protein EW146_g569 [Bondarzewia mesenterica]|uniref:Vacuolar membrane-associated protein IML1 n=1 Tax=Bondarzewia mesenterica TaxID=1095465 RepID=A0A4S4M6M4_9AGAM|nr:hypothetical protein EW146_g569 [Bondarzewia mesenterica]